MNRSKTAIVAYIFSSLLAGNLSPALAIAPNELLLYKGYYLEHQAKDFAGARALYERVLADNPDGEAVSVAKRGAARCRDQIAAQNFASLMPDDALAYVEINRPGELLHQVAGMLGLTAGDMDAALARRANAASTAMFCIPDQIVISPAIFEYLSGFGGAALAITGFDVEHEHPSDGVLVIHHGDATLMKGLLETAFQFAPTAEKVRDLPTFGSMVPELGQVTGVLTEALLIVGTGPEIVGGVVDRLTGKGKSSLASRADVEDYSQLHQGATLFAFADLQRILKLVKSKISESDKREFDTVNAIADLDSLRWASFSLGAHEGTLGAQFTLRLADDHRNLVYNFTRLPPISRQCLGHVPANAAGVFCMGLNPSLAQMASDAAKSQGARKNIPVTAFDIGREFFGNIRELAAFALPGEMIKGEIPNFGVVFAVNDIARSRALWDQLLSLPGLTNEEKPQAPRQINVAGKDVQVYSMPEFGSIYLAELDGCLSITATRSAMKAAIRAQGKKQSILDDASMGKALALLPSDTSIMAVANAGRITEIAATQMNSGEAMMARPAAEYCKNTVGWFALAQGDSRFTLKFAVTGLPNVNQAVKQFAPVMNSVAGMAAPRQDVVVKQAKPSQPKVVQKDGI